MSISEKSLSKEEKQSREAAIYLNNWMMKPVLPPRKTIERVIEAGRTAPSGSNSQTPRMIVITNRR